MRNRLTTVLALACALHLSADVMPPDAVVGGKTMDEWSGEWLKWMFSCPTNENPLRDLTGERAANCQPDGPVFFLAGVQFGDLTTATRTFTIEEGKYFFFPILNIYAADPGDPPTIEERRDAAATYLESYVEMHAIINGVAVPNLELYRARAPAFNFEFPSCDNMMTVNNGFCVSGLVENVVEDGFYLMVEPPSIGQHILNFGGSYGDPFTIDVTYHVTVVPTPLEQKVRELLNALEVAGLPAKRIRPLRNALSRSETAFEAGDSRAGVQHLRVFQTLVKAEFSRRHPDVATNLIERAQAIIDLAAQEPLPAAQVLGVSGGEDRRSHGYEPSFAGNMITYADRLSEGIGVTSNES